MPTPGFTPKNSSCRNRSRNGPTESAGGSRLSAFIKEHVGSELYVHECETDQSYLAQTVRELDAMVEMFPVRGTPT